MKDFKFYVFFIIISFLSVSCDKKEKMQFEKFSFIAYDWYQETPNDTIPKLRIGQYLEISDKNSIIYTNYYNRKEQCFNTHISDSIISLINQNFVNASIDSIPPPEPAIHDGLSYCYCLKKKGEKEKFYYYNYSLPPKWVIVHYYLDSLINCDTLVSITMNNDIRNRLIEIKNRFQWQTQISKSILTDSIIYNAPKIKN